MPDGSESEGGSPSPADLRKVLLRGGGFTLAAQALKFITQMTAFAVLGRLLLPADFGLIGVLGSSLALLELFREMGLTAAIIQRSKIGQDQLNLLFRISAGIGLVMFLFSCGVGWVVAQVLGDDRIAMIAPWCGSAFIFNSLGTVPLALMKRRMQFDRIAFRDSISFLCAVSLAIVAALAGWGYWALVVMPVTNSILGAALTWMAAGWRPSRETADFRSALPFLGFGGAFTAGEIANYLCAHVDNLLIGKIWGYQQLGFYTRGMSLMQMPINQVLGPLNSVLLPAMSRIREDKSRYGIWCERLLGGFTLVSAPVAAFVAVSAPWIVGIVLGPNWVETGRILAWLALVIYARPVGALIYLIMVTSGRLGILFRWVWVNSAMTVAAISLSVGFGAEKVAMSLGIAGAVGGVPIAIWFLSRTGDFRVARWFGRYVGGFLFGAVCYGVFACLGAILSSFGASETVCLAVLALALGSVLLMVGLFLRKLISSSLPVG